MKNKLSAALSALLTVAFLPSYIPVISVHAEGQALPVELTSAQTLALYGSSIPAYYYDGSSARSTTFEFYKSSKTLATECRKAFSSGFLGVTEPSNLFGFCNIPTFQSSWINEFVPAVNRGTWLIDSNGYINAEPITPFEFLIYRAPINLNTVNQEDFDFQINLDFSIALDGVERFCTINAYSIATVSSFDSHTNAMKRSVSCSNMRSTLNFYTNLSSSNPFGVTSDCYLNSISNNYFGFALHPINTADLSMYYDNNLQANYWSDAGLTLFPCPGFSMCYFDSGDLASPTSFSSMSWDIFAASGCVLREDQWTTNSNPSYDQAYTYLMLMCPVVWGDVSQPDPEPGTPDYNSSLDTIISNTHSTNTKLDQILIKLDLIYQQMQQDGGSADIDAPDVIGLTPTAKQRVLSGMSELDSTFEDVDPEDLPTDAFQGFSSGWSAIKAIFPNGLWSIYMLSLVGGIVAWIIYGKRS